MKKMIGLAALAVAGTVLAAKPDYATFICHRGESHDALSWGECIVSRKGKFAGAVSLS